MLCIHWLDVGFECVNIVCSKAQQGWVFVKYTVLWWYLWLNLELCISQDPCKSLFIVSCLRSIVLFTALWASLTPWIYLRFCSNKSSYWWQVYSNCLRFQIQKTSVAFSVSPLSERPIQTIQMFFLNFTSPDPSEEHHLHSPAGNCATGTQSK